ncbi:hypothetical protein ACTU44_06770 [Thalassospira sp. SM2505]|uniref:Uncharacterized protein n=1 Tax=Thalassospira profundimaris TaxID=502049 RepID=A0A367WRC2_9PROT|nr:hypothetical protein [Thalassospira profundimaris]RCK43917.1 hypothetical protein TH30_16230 [Thalassospira profundimaris]
MGKKQKSGIATMRAAFGMVNAAIGALFHFLGDRTRLFFFMVAGLLGLLISGNLLGTVKQLEALPDDNDDQGRKNDFRKAQHVRSQSTMISAAKTAAMSHLYANMHKLETGQW